jgi:hypothetical protein
MSWWGDKSQQNLVEQPVVDRGAEALCLVQGLKSELAQLDAEMLRFRTKHRARVSRFDVLLSVHSPSMNGYAAIRNEWDSLLKRRDKIVAQWHASLRIWSEIKEQRK